MTRRQLGWGLLAYGIAGIVLVVATGWFGLAVAGEIDELAAGAQRTLDAAARSTEAAADAVAGVDDALVESQASIDTAAALAGDVSDTLSRLGRAMEISVFGAQPLLPLADDFASVSTQASTLGDTLARLGASLEETAPDTSRISVELQGLSAELSGLSAAIGGSEGSATPIVLFVLLLLAWLLVPAIGGLLGGLALLGLIRPLRLLA
jgi:hypothetical protein